ncbi:MAG: tetratricopeptide repeat protein [Planctomycetes bacterium]|nr:tetratricopeptide repeat protein [Planctomycetota bacterium]
MKSQRIVFGLLVLLVACSKPPSSEAAPPEHDAGDRRAAGKSKARLFQFFREASDAKKEGRLEEAIELYHQALELNPEHEGSLVDLSHVYRLLGQRQDAVQVLDRLRRTQPRLPRPYFLLAEVLSEEPASAEDLQRAADLYTQALDLEPNVLGPRLGLADVAFRQGHLEDARECFRLALGTDPNCLRALRGLATIHLRSDRPAEAIPLLVKALELGTKAQGRADVPSEMDTQASFADSTITTGENRSAWLALARAAHALGGYPADVPPRFRHPSPQTVGAED